MTASGLRTFVLLAGALIVGGITQVQAQNASPTQTASQPAKDAAASNKPAATQPAKVAAAQKSDDDAQLVKDARDAGFKPMQVRGNLMFCRTAKELGSNFPVRTCYDAQQVKIKIHEYQTERGQLESMHNTGMFTH